MNVREGGEAHGVNIRLLAPGKINLCLFLGPVRADGRHELVTVYESVSLADELVISDGVEGDEVVAPGVDGPNLVALALEGLRRAGWQAPPLRVEIDKRIPVAAGMGGGSADAAAILRVAPRLAPIGAAEVAELAASLGADVPAAVTPGVALGTGAGEVVSPWPELAAHALVIVPLDAQLSTPAVYTEADRLGLPRPAEELQALLGRLEAAGGRLESAGTRLDEALIVNDLESAARSLCPAVGDALEAVLRAGADHALVCGSGPTVAGIFWGDAGSARAGAAVEALLGEFPRATTALPISSPASGTMGR